jgi:CRP-like cAMP-binding protein
LNPLCERGEKPGLACNRARPFLLSYCSFSPLPAALTGSQLSELRSARLQSPVAVTAPRACPAEHAQSLRERTRPPLDIQRLLAHLSPLTLRAKCSLYEQGEQIDTVYFLEDAIASVVITMENGSTVEVGLIGGGTSW